MADNQKKLGFFSRLLDAVPAGERYRLAEEQIIYAEKLGFETAWVAQHHFHPQEGGLPSPFVFLSNIAAKTKKIRLGTGVITLPMESPVRVAEDAAVFDLLSNGRLELGFGTGGTRESFEVFGVDPDKRGEVYAHHLDVLRKAFAGEDLLDGNRLYPAAPHLLRRFWMATFSPFGGKLAGEKGDGLMLSRTQPRPADNPEATLDEIQNPIIDAYLSALPAGVKPRIMASRSLFVSRDRAHALELAEKGLRSAAKRLGKALTNVKGCSLDDLIVAFDQHVGTPEDVIASLKKDTSLNRATDVVFQVHSIDPPHEEILKSLELTAKEVAPALGLSLASH
ncbi:putative FMN-dependent luciferase-like monooxygenase [Bartonella apihabitans]|uniref:putative FMN-dependent luciferase-like monooxygenase n=1 Tax=uncultured Bartonella sp. TaxID=104108 RepID=UPI0025CF52F8|nr:putative FMN-dependent luciferase-like monooxygenase [Bartonella apihabitans]WLT09179.1 putative FMN-dependent luciferase-like monooxygenase [Bartonella apihabitans]